MRVCFVLLLAGCLLAATGCTNRAAPAAVAAATSGVAVTGASSAGTDPAPSEVAEPSPTSIAASNPVALPTVALPTVALPTPVTIVEVGDSLGLDLGYGLRDVLAGNADIKVVAAAKGDSGLVHQEFYNWPQHVHELVSTYKPAVVVVFLGANDVQNFYDHGVYYHFGTDAWKSVYAQRVAALMQQATATGSRVLWVGMPIMRDPDFAHSMQIVNAIYQALAENFAQVTYFPSWQVFSGPSGEYLATTKASDGSTADLRTPDGIHIAFGRPGDGAWVLATAVLDKLHHLYGLPAVGVDG